MAAQNWHTLHAPAMHTSLENEVIKTTDTAPVNNAATETPSVLDAGIRFACW